jgi:prepilin-type N-terminal cleavage/methylation domain-containing protein
MIVRTASAHHNPAAMQPPIVGRLCQTLICPSLAFHRMEPLGCERHGRAARSGERAGANESNALQQRRSHRAFTLIELLVVIAIIAILIGLLFPAFRAVQDQAKRTQAKNDLTQIVNAVNAYYTDYGKYPWVTDDSIITDNASLMSVLRGLDPTNNPRQIVFTSPSNVKDTNNPRSGIGSNGQYYDPFGTPYRLRIDGNYNNQLANPYTADSGAGPSPLNIGAIGWSLGKDQSGGSGNKNSGAADDDVISWQ